MSHMVIFRDAEGKPGYHQAEALEQAVRFVEELRNERQVTDARVFSMQEVALEFKTYWKVEVTAEAPGPPVPAPAPALPGEGFVSALAVADPIDADADADTDSERPPLSYVPGDLAPPTHGRFGLFGRS